MLVGQRCWKYPRSLLLAQARQVMTSVHRLQDELVHARAALCRRHLHMLAKHGPRSSCENGTAHSPHCQPRREFITRSRCIRSACSSGDSPSSSLGGRPGLLATEPSGRGPAVQARKSCSYKKPRSRTDCADAVEALLPQSPSRPSSWVNGRRPARLVVVCFRQAWTARSGENLIRSRRS